MDKEEILDDHISQVERIRELEEKRRETERELIEIESELEREKETLVEEIEFAWQDITDNELEQFEELADSNRFSSLKRRIMSVLG